MASLNILCSGNYDFLKEVTQKDSSRIFKNISWLINICLKYFMASANTLQPPSYIFNVWSLTTMKPMYKIENSKKLNELKFEKDL